jgi:hypothetical protein
MSDGAPLVDRIRRDGASADVADEPRETPDAAFVAARLRAAAALPPEESARALAVWDEAGARHDPATIDAVLGELTAGGWVPFVGARGRKGLRLSARAAMAGTRRRGTLELAVAVLGAIGRKEDAEALEIVARHPAFTLHAATALSNLDHWQGRASLLRLLTQTNGAERVVVIDRLLPHLREPAVRLALVRDALTGLAPEHAREVAPDIAAMLDVRSLADNPKTPEDIRAGARAVLAACPAEGGQRDAK